MIVDYLIVDDLSLRVVDVGSCAEDIVMLQQPGNGRTLFIVAAELARDAIAGAAKRWLLETESLEDIEPTLEEVIFEKHIEIKQARFAAESAGVQVPGIGLLQTDPRSREFIFAARVEAFMSQVLAQPYSLVGLLNAANEPVDVDAAQVLAISAIVSDWMAVVFNRTQILRGRIDEATTVAEVRAIGWTIADA